MRAKVVALAALLAAPYSVAFGISINTFNQIVSFGDSLSDAGNASIATAGVFPGANYATRTVAGVPFPVGYFTDGPGTTPGTGTGPTGLWIDQLAAKMGVTDPVPALAPLGGTNYAVGSALTGSSNAQDMQNQVNLFLSQHLTGASASSLYTFWGGANDLLGGNNPKQAADNIFSQIQEVAADGGKYFLWLNLPALGDTPEGSTLGAAALNAASAAFNAEWSSDVSTLDSHGLSVIGVDVSSLVSQMIANKGAFGLTDVTNPCSGNPACTNPNSYLFWDALHPTTQGDMYVANLALADLTAVPEPATFALMFLGGCGLLALRRSKRRAVRGN